MKLKCFFSGMVGAILVLVCVMLILLFYSDYRDRAGLMQAGDSIGSGIELDKHRGESFPHKLSQ